MLNRREAMILAAGSLAATSLCHASETAVHDYGWPADPELRRNWLKTQEKPYYAEFAGEIAGSGRGKQTRLWTCLEKVTQRPYFPSIQTIGDCTSHATAMGVNILTAVQMLMHGRPERWVAPAATEPIHAGARVEVGRGRIPARRDGALVSWAGEWVRLYGVLLRQKYGTTDLTKYNPGLARYWGSPNVGVPDHLEPIAKEHPVKMVKVVTCWPEARDLIANGYPVVIGSDVGFNSESDSDGFLSAGPTWWHALLLAGVDDKSKRPGGCLLNWWPPDWTSGPKHKLGTPESAFWVDASTIDRMLQEGDSIALSNYVGYRRQPLNYMLIPR